MSTLLTHFFVFFSLYSLAYPTTGLVVNVLADLPENGASRSLVPCAVEMENFQVCRLCQDEVTDEQLLIVRLLFGESEHRDWHLNWHLIRDQFNYDGMNTLAPTEKSLSAWHKEGWIPNSDLNNLAQFSRLHRAGGLVAGEDFLYMHRQMIKMSQSILSKYGLPCIAPWYDMPETVKDPLWPVPRVTHILKKKN